MLTQFWNVGETESRSAAAAKTIRSSAVEVVTESKVVVVEVVLFTLPATTSYGLPVSITPLKVIILAYT